jgi:hypothetical protein
MGVFMVVMMGGTGLVFETGNLTNGGQSHPRSPVNTPLNTPFVGIVFYFPLHYVT